LNIRPCAVRHRAQPQRRAREQAGERCLAHRERIASQVFAVELHQIEGP
jgi:hypothetical protein